MSVYMRAEDNDAGVTVEECGDGCEIGPFEVNDYGDLLRFTDAEARAVVVGLLRRMLEREGVEKTYSLWLDVTRNWEMGR
jgi:hypothetical protein